MAQNPFYVYALKDPRQQPAKPFTTDYKPLR